MNVLDRTKCPAWLFSYPYKLILFQIKQSLFGKRLVSPTSSLSLIPTEYVILVYTGTDVTSW